MASYSNSEGGLPNNDQIKIIGVDPFTLSKNSAFINLFLKKEKVTKNLINNRLAFASPETINKISKLNLNLELVKTDSLLKNFVLVDISIAEKSFK